jgi:hypothetical protein
MDVTLAVGPFGGLAHHVPFQIKLDDVIFRNFNGRQSSCL